MPLHVPHETTGLAQPLCFTEVAVGSALFRLGALGVFDIDREAVPEIDLAGLVAQWKDPRAMPAVNPVGATQPGIPIERLSRFDRGGPAREDFIAILRVEVVGGRLGPDLLESLVEVVEHLLVAEGDPAL